MSPRAAWRLETLGFTEVYDYAAGKADWFASGRPIEGTHAAVPRIGSLARTDVPTSSLSEQVAVVAHRTTAAGWDTCIVVNEDRVILGRLFHRELHEGSDRPVEEVMRSGPSTFRPNVSVQEMIDFMDDRDLTTALVSGSDGRLMGVFRREDAREG